MANRTDPLAQSVRGLDPQFLIEKILRTRIYANRYWKEHCFGLTAESVVDKAVELEYLGGTYSQNAKPTAFICLLLKLLQVQPDKEIVLEYIRNEDYKYVRALGAMYLRLTGRAVDVYTYLEPLYNDFRKLAMRSPSGWSLTYMDEFVDALLHEETVCDVTLPHLPKRSVLEATGALQPRVSALEDELLMGDDAGDTEGGGAALPPSVAAAAASAADDSGSDDGGAGDVAMGGAAAAAAAPSSGVAGDAPRPQQGAHAASSSRGDAPRRDGGEIRRGHAAADLGDGAPREPDRNRRRSRSGSHDRRRERSRSGDRYRRREDDYDRGYRGGDGGVGRSGRDDSFRRYDDDRHRGDDDRDGGRYRRDYDRGSDRRDDGGYSRHHRSSREGGWDGDRRGRSRSGSRDRYRRRSPSGDRQGGRDRRSRSGSRDRRARRDDDRREPPRDARTTAGRDDYYRGGDGSGERADRRRGRSPSPPRRDAVGADDGQEPPRKKPAPPRPIPGLKQPGGAVSAAGPTAGGGGGKQPAEGSVEYWNAQRAALGLKPLK